MAEWMEEQLLRLLEGFKRRLPEADYVHVRGMLEHREWGVGLEDLCTQLHEHSIVVRESEFKEIKKLTSQMGLSSKTWSHLATETDDL